MCGRTKPAYPVSSPGAFGSGKLKCKYSITTLVTTIIGYFCTKAHRKHRFSFCLACEAEARHMYCFSGVVVVVVVVVGGGGVNFFVFRSFSRKLYGLEP